MALQGSTDRVAVDDDVLVTLRRAHLRGTPALLPLAALLLWGWHYAGLRGTPTHLLQTWWEPAAFVIATAAAAVALVTRGLQSGWWGAVRAVRWLAPGIGLTAGLFLTFAALSRLSRPDEFGPPLGQALVMALTGVVIGLAASFATVWRAHGRAEH